MKVVAQIGSINLIDTSNFNVKSAATVARMSQQLKTMQEEVNTKIGNLAL